MDALPLDILALLPRYAKETCALACMSRALRRLLGHPGFRRAAVGAWRHDPLRLEALWITFPELAPRLLGPRASFSAIRADRRPLDGREYKAYKVSASGARSVGGGRCFPADVPYDVKYTSFFVGERLFIGWPLAEIDQDTGRVLRTWPTPLSVELDPVRNATHLALHTAAQIMVFDLNDPERPPWTLQRSLTDTQLILLRLEGGVLAYSSCSTDLNWLARWEFTTALRERRTTPCQIWHASACYYAGIDVIFDKQLRVVVALDAYSIAWLGDDAALLQKNWHLYELKL